MNTLLEDVKYKRYNANICEHKHSKPYSDKMKGLKLITSNIKTNNPRRRKNISVSNFDYQVWSRV